MSEPPQNYCGGFVSAINHGLSGLSAPPEAGFPAFHSFHRGGLKFRFIRPTGVLKTKLKKLLFLLLLEAGDWWPEAVFK